MRAVKARPPEHDTTIIETHIVFSSPYKNAIAPNNDLASKGFLSA